MRTNKIPLAIKDYEFPENIEGWDLIRKYAPFKFTKVINNQHIIVTTCRWNKPTITRQLQDINEKTYALLKYYIDRGVIFSIWSGGGFGKKEYDLDTGLPDLLNRIHRAAEYSINEAYYQPPSKQGWWARFWNMFARMRCY